jgi:hypothetical protein
VITGFAVGPEGPLQRRRTRRIACPTADPCEPGLVAIPRNQPMTDAPNPFQSLAACLGEDERLRLELHRTGATLAVLVQPVLKAAPPGLDAERQRGCAPRWPIRCG